MSSTKKILVIFFISLTLLSPSIAFTQIIPVGDLLDDQLEINFLLADSTSFPLVQRPVTNKIYQSIIGEDTRSSGWWNRDLSPTPLLSKKEFQAGLYSTSIQQTYNSKIPYGENNGAAWYSRGMNLEFKGGFFITSKYFSINLNPHIIYQENLDFLTPRFIPTDSNGNIRYVNESIKNGLDAPFRYGPSSFSTFDSGNSSIRLHYKKLETGISTEPLWWGPAARYPLLFSNNAPGIPHFFFGNPRPFAIPYFGNVSVRWIFGYPQDSEYYDEPEQNLTRFFSALNITYRPFFYPNLTIGISRNAHLYEQNGFSFAYAILPFDPTTISSRFNLTGEEQDKNQAISFYAQIHLPKAKAKIYGEFYREDHSYDVRDFINQPQHNSAYSFGFQKISYLPWINFLKTNIEITNLTTSALRQVRVQPYLYTHNRVRQGHTNRGQFLGAAIGPGSNSQFISFDAYKGNYTFGLFAQRWVDNDNFHFIRGSRSIAPPNDFGDYFRHRVNINLGFNALYGPGPFYINSRLIWTKAYNYGRFNYGEFEGVTIQNYEKNDLINIQFQMGLTYIF